MCDKYIDFKIGSIVFVKKAAVKKYGFNPSFIKNGCRPFVIGDITDYGAFWIVPSYSRCSDMNKKTEKYYQKVYTGKGECKYLKFRDMIVVERSDLLSKTLSENIIFLSDVEILNFKRRFKTVKSILQKNRNYFESNYYAPFVYEKSIICKYLETPYLWLERDFNKVDPVRNFSIYDELSKSDFASALYYYYLNNLKYYLLSRDKYIPIRKTECISYFHERKTEIAYKCLTDNGYVLSLIPLCYTNNHNKATILRENELALVEEEFDTEQVKIKVPLLNKSQEERTASELIWLDNNIVSQKTYYDVFGKLPNSEEIKEKITEVKKNEH